MLGRKRPRVSSATGTWKPRKKARVINRAVGSSGLRTGGWRGVPGRRGELKYVDVAITGQSATPGGILTLLNGLAPGTGASQRIGKKIIMKSILFRAAIGGNSGTFTIPFQGSVRCLIIQDKQANATAPTVAQILEVATGTSPMNMDNRERFLVLANKSVPIDQNGGHQSGKINVYKRMNLPVVFNNGTAGTVADITSGSVYLLLIAEQALVGAPTTDPISTWYSRIRYDDA